MVQCQNCGNQNTAESNFCRFCGTKFIVYQPQAQANYEYSPLRPYAWKTDEFQTQNEARKPVEANRPQPAGYYTGNDAFASQPLTNRPAYIPSAGYRCPHCMSQFLPRLERRISTAGWITFAVLLVAFFPLFWIGLLIKEDIRVCPSCCSVVG